MFRHALSTALLVGLVAPHTAAYADESPSVSFTPPGYAFSVSFPTAPAHDRRSTPTIIGDIYTDVWGAKHEGGDYSVSITDLPRVAIWFNSRAGLFEKARDKMMETLGATQSGLRPLKRGDFTEELDYFVPGQLGQPARRGRAWFALIDDKLVVITALVPLGTSSKLDRHFAAIDPDAATIAHR